jgi:16S rRNA (guanine527-N7)-methyltransferase
LPVEINIRWFASRIEEHLTSISLSQDQLKTLYAHFELLVIWNSKINLTSIRSPEEIVVRHYCESLFFASNLPVEPTAETIADIGSGAGFPGFPIAVLKPNCHVTLVESHQRKAVFLRESTRGLSNISVVAQRAEHLDCHFDWVVARAVAPEEVLSLTPKLSPNIGLLIGAPDFGRIEQKSGIAWLAPVPIPWANRQLCVLGRCST